MKNEGAKHACKCEDGNSSSRKYEKPVVESASLFEKTVLSCILAFTAVTCDGYKTTQGGGKPCWRPPFNS